MGFNRFNILFAALAVLFVILGFSWTIAAADAANDQQAWIPI